MYVSIKKGYFGTRTGVSVGQRDTSLPILLPKLSSSPSHAEKYDVSPDTQRRVIQDAFSMGDMFGQVDEESTGVSIPVPKACDLLHEPDQIPGKQSMRYLLEDRRVDKPIEIGDVFKRASILDNLAFMGDNKHMDFKLYSFLHSSEHCIDNCPIVLRDDEPTTVIAFTLSSKDYLQQIAKLERKGGMEEETELTDFNETVQEQIEKVLQTASPAHINYGFWQFIFISFIFRAVTFCY